MRNFPPIENCQLESLRVKIFEIMDVIEKNKLLMNELAADSPQLAEQVNALDWDELQSRSRRMHFQEGSIRVA